MHVHEICNSGHVFNIVLHSFEINVHKRTTTDDFEPYSGSYRRVGILENERRKTNSVASLKVWSFTRGDHSEGFYSVLTD